MYRFARYALNFYLLSRRYFLSRNLLLVLISTVLITLQICVIAQNSFAENNEKYKMVERKIIDANWGRQKGEIGEVPGSRTGHTAGDSINPIAVDSSGNVYVGDSLNHRVQKYNQQGEFIHEIKLVSQGGWPVIEDIYVESDVQPARSDQGENQQAPPRGRIRAVNPELTVIQKIPAPKPEIRVEQRGPFPVEDRKKQNQ